MTKRPAVIVTGLPWIRSGTGKVMQAQIEYFKSLGWTVLFVACPYKRTDSYSRRIWQRFEQEKADLKADHTAIATFRRRRSRPGLVQRLRGRWHGYNAMHWALAPSEAADVPLELINVAHGFDVRLILANHIYTLKVAQKVRARLTTSPPIALVTHDAQSHILLDNSEVNPFTAQPDTIDDLLKIEIQVLSDSDYLLHVSSDDELFFRGRLPNVPHKLVLPTIEDCSEWGHDQPRADAVDFLFVGAKHIANYYAVVWLLEEVWPWLDQRRTIKIVGPVKELVSSQNPNLYRKFSEHFTGSVPEVAQYYRSSRCVLAPMLTGRGVSVKTIEACAFGVPIVGTSSAYRGLPREEVEAAGLRAYDEPNAFAQAAQLALDDPRPFREASRRLYRALFSFHAFESSMSEALCELKIVG